MDIVLDILHKWDLSDKDRSALFDKWARLVKKGV